VGPSVGIVDDLVRDGKDSRAKGIGDTADCRQSDDLFGTASIERPEVGTIIEPMRQYAVPHPVPGEEEELGTAQKAPYDRRRSRAVGGVGPLVVENLESQHSGETGAADDGQSVHVEISGKFGVWR